jgi:hypothetical protein
MSVQPRTRSGQFASVYAGGQRFKRRRRPQRAQVDGDGVILRLGPVTVMNFAGMTIAVVVLSGQGWCAAIGRGA